MSAIFGFTFLKAKWLKFSLHIYDRTHWFITGTCTAYVAACGDVKDVPLYKYNYRENNKGTSKNWTHMWAKLIAMLFSWRKLMLWELLHLLFEVPWIFRTQMEYGTEHCHMTGRNCSGCPNFKVRVARTQHVTRPIFTWLKMVLTENECYYIVAKVVISKG